MTCLTAWAGNKNTSVLVRHITQAQRGEIPDKTIELKLQRYTLNDAPLAKALLDLVADIREDDLSHNFFVLKFHTSEAGEFQVSVIGLEQLNGSVITKTSWGIWQYESACFVLFDEKPEGLFAKAKGKYSIIQEFEIVDVPFDDEHTIVEACWKDGMLSCNFYFINGNDLLQKRKWKEDGYLFIDHFE